VNTILSAGSRVTTSADVLVIGGGLWGLSVAWHLSTRHGASVTVLERRSGPARETSALSAGHLAQVHARRLERAAGRYAVQFAAGLARRRDPDLFVPSGSVTLFERGHSADELHARFADAGAEGTPVQRVSTTDAVRLVPGLAGPFAACYHVPTDARVDPGRYALALAADAAEHGVRFVYRTTVLDLLVARGRAQTVRTTRGPFSAPVVVLSAGPWTPTFIPQPSWRPAVLPIVLRQARTARAGVSPLHPVVRVPEIGAVLGPDDGGYLFGSCQTGPGQSQCLPLPMTSRSEHLPEDRREALDAQRRLRRWLPELGRLPIVEHRQGWTTFSPDGYPVAGRDPRIANLWVATGCGALGDLWAPALGRWLAQSVAADAPVAELSALDPARFGARAADPHWVHGECLRRHAASGLPLFNRTGVV
jgi:glycine/D-amino acid oxidase-like deaminating enzyme